MVEQPDLLRAVVENPDLDGPRLAYADWCATIDEDDMRARAEFIRAQIQLLYTPAETLNTGGAYFAQRRIAELVDRWGETWAEPVRPFVTSYSFQRGFVGHVAMTARGFLENAERLFAVAPVRHLDLMDVRELRDSIASSPFLGRLTSLSLDGCGLASSDIRSLVSTPSLFALRWLSLRDNRLDLDGARAIAASPYLKMLRVVRFEGNPVDPFEELGLDGGVVVDTKLPESGVALEKEFGRLRWLHWSPENNRYA